MSESTKKLKPAEGLCVNLPNGKPAIQFITYKNLTVKTYVDDSSKVQIIIDFDEPFIKQKGNHED